MKWHEFALCEIVHDSPQVRPLKILHGVNESLVRLFFSLSLFKWILLQFEFLVHVLVNQAVHKVFWAVPQTVAWRWGHVYGWLVTNWVNRTPEDRLTSPPAKITVHYSVRRSFPASSQGWNSSHSLGR